MNGFQFGTKHLSPSLNMLKLNQLILILFKMRTKEEIESKIDELDSEKDDIENEFQETLEDEEIEEDSEKGEDLRFEYDQKIEAVEKQIELLEWVLEE